MEDFFCDLESHNRTIIHFDMDYFYAQVEEILNPSLKTRPIGIQQKNCLVTSNYVARKYNVTKMMTVAEAKRLCPQLELINGEDLTKYKQMSTKIFEILLKYTPLVEKLGLDENYLDVSEIVNQKVSELNSRRPLQVKGCIYPLEESLDSCKCGCWKRLIIATHIADDIRKELYETLKITCCAGIAHNKLLAKLVGTMNKPNNQTVLVATFAESFMRELGSVKKITGIGVKTELLLKEIGITSIEDLQNCDMETLRKKLGYESAYKLKEFAFGRDSMPVRTTGKPKSIGLEDSCRPISVRKDVEERFRLLLMRLVNQVSEDGRIPITIKVILRKYDANKKTSHRETKQANISPSLFRYHSHNKIILAEGAQEKLIKIIMKLFDRIIDMNKAFNITLLGLAFSKFQERKHGSSSIANFLIKKTDLEVQSVTSLKSEGVAIGSTSEPADGFYRRRTIASSPLPVYMDVESVSDISDFSETEIEPSPKKTRLGLLIAKRRCISSNDLNDIASPSKLRVAELRLNSRDSEKDSTNIAANNIGFHHVNPTSQNICTNDCQTIKSDDNENCNDATDVVNINDSQGTEHRTSSILATTITGNLANIPCPTGVDSTVFKELPIDVQNELVSSWRNSLAVKANTSNISTTSTANAPTNTLHRYFIKNN